MATAPIIENTSLAVVPATTTAAVVLFDSDKFDNFYAKLKADAEAVPIDLTTRKGREAIASIAAKIRSEKASIDKDRLRLTKEWRDMTAQVNGAWNTIKERLDDLAVEVRAPLTEWEEVEKARIERCREIIEAFKADAIVTLEDTAATVRARGGGIWQTALDEEQFRDMLPEAQAAKDAAVATLKAALARLEKEEADRAELERLRAEAAERDRIEAERRAEEERAAREAEEARQAEERRIAAERAEQERIERAKREAEDRARRKAEQAAEAERQRIQREHDEALAAERRRAEEAERAANAERERVAAEEAARKAEAEQAAAEQAKRDADQAHRSAVMKAAKEAIMTCGVDEETAKKVVLLIRSGEVPNVTLRF